jgi:hypothetical protein
MAILRYRSKLFLSCFMKWLNWWQLLLHSPVDSSVLYHSQIGGASVSSLKEFSISHCVVRIWSWNMIHFNRPLTFGLGWFCRVRGELFFELGDYQEALVDLQAADRCVRNHEHTLRYVTHCYLVGKFSCFSGQQAVFFSFMTSNWGV